MTSETNPDPLASTKEETTAIEHIGRTGIQDPKVKSKNDRWTPWDFYYSLHTEFNFDLDIAASEHNTKVPGNYVTKSQNALSIPDWSTLGQSIWCNCPYGRKNLPAFVQECSRQVNENGVTVVMLLDARTDSWFLEHILGRWEVRFLKGRLAYHPYTDKHQSPSMVIVMRPGILPLMRQIQPVQAHSGYFTRKQEESRISCYVTYDSCGEMQMFNPMNEEGSLFYLPPSITDKKVVPPIFGALCPNLQKDYPDLHIFGSDPVDPQVQESEDTVPVVVESVESVESVTTEEPTEEPKVEAVEAADTVTNTETTTTKSTVVEADLKLDVGVLEYDDYPTLEGDDTFDDVVSNYNTNLREYKNKISNLSDNDESPLLLQQTRIVELEETLRTLLGAWETSLGDAMKVIADSEGTIQDPALQDAVEDALDGMEAHAYVDNQGLSDGLKKGYKALEGYSASPRAYYTLPTSATKETTTMVAPVPQTVQPVEVAPKIPAATAPQVATSPEMKAVPEETPMTSVTPQDSASPSPIPEITLEF